MILSEDNDAARLLSRPGQAIYNDANGLFEGNHPFQVVWLPDDERREILQRLEQYAEVAQRSSPHQDWAPVVFEGSAAADPRENRAWLRALDSPPSETPLAPQAWLGAPIAISPAPAAVLRRQNGQNMVLIGPQGDLATATLSQAVLGLLSYSPRHGDFGSRFQCAILSPGDDATQGPTWQLLAEHLDAYIQFRPPAEIAACIRSQLELLELRLATGQERGPAQLLVVPRISRFRDLHLAEADLGFTSFSRHENSTSTQQAFQRLIKEGPAVGIHVLLWCDQLQDFHRALGRTVMNEFHHRIAFPMNASDSSQFIDSPDASRLGPLRAIYHRADIGVSEKFRPYVIPDSGWLETIRTALYAHEPHRSREGTRP